MMLENHKKLIKIKQKNYVDATFLKIVRAPTIQSAEVQDQKPDPKLLDCQNKTFQQQTRPKLLKIQFL